MDRNELKAMLRKSAENDFQVPEGHTAHEIAAIMLDHSGDTDPEMRDDLCYRLFYRWSDRRNLSDEEMRLLLVKAADSAHLLKGIGQIDDTVFMRSFSALWIAIGIYRHRVSPFLQPEEVRFLMDRLLVFYENDLDVRGFIDTKGWAHGAAHGADALDEFARCSETGAPDLMRILEALRGKAMNGSYGYVHQEDERMVTAVTAVLERGMLDETWLATWISGFGHMTLTGSQPHDVVLRVNITHFLRSLAYRLQKPAHAGIGGAARVVAEVTTVLQQIDTF